MQKLNDAQKEAVSHFEGPMLVLAGPGSGKTRVITERIHYLISQRNVSPNQILVITYTKAAAGEMRERYRRLYREDPKGVRFGTFHAIFFMILKHAYHYTAENVIQEDMRRDLLRRIVQKTDLELPDVNEFIADLETEIGKVKGNRINLYNYYSPLCAAEVFREIFHQYQRWMERKRLLDFDDMLVYCYELLKARPDILALWQKQFTYILIDEFQDICLIQYDIIKMLAAPCNNLFIVGDDDQSIYGFRGARPDIMRQFLKDYKDARQCLLDVNYRCPLPILLEAGKVIGRNQNRLPKEIKAARFNHPADLKEEIAGEELQKRILDGTEEILTVQRYPKSTEENEAIRKKILLYHGQGISYREMAVLFRTNIQARALSAKLMEYNIPFLIKEGVPDLYHHWVVQDIFTYVQVAKGDREREKLLRIINRPKRYVHRNAFIEPCVDLEELKLFYEEKDWMVERIEHFQEDLKMLARMRPYAAVNFVRKGIGYDDYIREYARYRGIREEEFFEILEELLEESKKFDRFEAWYTYIEEYEEELRQQAGKRARGEEEDAVMLLTMHGAKGLEYDCVFIPDANEGVVPHSKSVLEVDMEEERRMFYVAMTRAKRHLHISYLQERFHKAVDASRFVEEMF